MPESRWVAHWSPVRFAQRKILRFSALPVSAFSSTRAYTFSYRRGTPIRIVGRTSLRFWGTASIDSA